MAALIPQVVVFYMSLGVRAGINPAPTVGNVVLGLGEGGHGGHPYGVTGVLGQTINT